MDSLIESSMYGLQTGGHVQTNLQAVADRLCVRFGCLLKVPQPLEAKVHDSKGMCLLVGRLQQQCMQACLPFPKLLQALRLRGERVALC